MAFNRKIAELVAYRSAYICNNPECNTLTVGPALSSSTLKTKKGEAAHIIGEKDTAARYEDIGAAAGEADNAIWLCANCHTLVDKNNGIDYSKVKLLEWKKDHENMISMLLRTHKSPLPLVARHTKNGIIAQNIADAIFNRGAFFRNHSVENQFLVISSISEARKIVARQMRDIDYDKKLRNISAEIIDACREFLNDNSVDQSTFWAYLEVLRAKIKRQLDRLVNEYGVSSSGLQIVPIGP